jgi:phage terminase large subunit
METANQTQSELTVEQRREAGAIVADPVRFAERVLGVELWSAEIEMLRSIEENRRTAIKACHGVGKSFALAIATLWWLVRWEDGMVLTTAPTERTVKTLTIWKEIHTLAARSKIKFPEANAGSLWLRGRKEYPDNFALALTANRPENFQGGHSNHLLIIADEAPGIQSGIWDAIAGSLTGRDVRIVMAGNPTIPTGAFFDAFHHERSMWHCISMSVFDTPNIAPLRLEQLLAMDQAGGGPLDEVVVPYLPSRRWVVEQYMQWWHGEEASSPMWQSRVLGEFPAEASNSLFRLAWLERAGRAAKDDPARRLIAGVDVGGGEAETVCYLCQSTAAEKRILSMAAWRKPDTLDDVARFLDPYLKTGRLQTVRVDAIGIGHNFGLYLRKKGFPVEMVNVGMPCENRPERHENNPSERFSNLKAQYYQNLADAFERGEVAGLTDELTITQLIGVLYEIDSRGRLKIESKAEAAARGVPSPDRAEALMLALGQAPREYAFYSIGDAIDPAADDKPPSTESVWEANWRAAAERRERQGSGSFGFGRLKKSRRYDLL